MKKGKEKVYTAHFVWINSFRSSCDIIQASINDRVDSSVTFSKSIHKSFVCIEVISVHLHKGLAQRIKLILITITCTVHVHNVLHPCVEALAV